MSETPPAPASVLEKFSTEDERAAARWGWHLGWAECQRVIYEALSTARDESPELREEDLRTDLWRNLAVQPSMQHVAVRITHLPTGLVGTAEGWPELRVKAEALAELQRKVAEASPPGA